MCVYCVCTCMSACAYMCTCVRVRICMCLLEGGDEETQTTAQQVGAVEVRSVLCRGWEETPCLQDSGDGWALRPPPLPSYQRALPLRHHLAQPCLSLYPLVSGPRYPCFAPLLKCGTPDSSQSCESQNLGHPATQPPSREPSGKVTSAPWASVSQSAKWG